MRGRKQGLERLNCHMLFIELGRNFQVPRTPMPQPCPENRPARTKKALAAHLPMRHSLFSVWGAHPISGEEPMKSDPIFALATASCHEINDEGATLAPSFGSILLTLLRLPSGAPPLTQAPLPTAIRKLATRLFLSWLADLSNFRSGALCLDVEPNPRATTKKT